MNSQRPFPRSVCASFSGPFRLVALPLVFGMLLTAGCAAKFSGWAVDHRGRPVEGARVQVNGATATTRTDGRFEVSARRADQYILIVSHREYADVAHTSRTPLEDLVWPLVKAQVSEVDPKAPITLVDERQDLDDHLLFGASFTLPPNALVDAQGNAPAGMVRGAIATLDLTNGEGPTDWGVRSGDGRDGYLVSYGAVFLQFSDVTGGTTYQLRSGVSGQLSLPVLSTMRDHVIETTSVPFWYYDQSAGEWKKAGDATYDASAGAYLGSVNHLSTINTDIAKFDNAACLAITLDSSIPTGHKLRIRYHSGGTPFGQVPTFVMNDTLNAAYRLPANTNVLLELLNSSDQVFGNLVVEDPPGTALINNVVDTGAALPSGSSLWPPAPYSPCKPLILRFGSPEVEIRINELESAVLPMDDPTDDYLTWAPMYALARLTTPMTSAVNVVLTNDTPNIGGNIRFAAHQDPWPATTTATASTLALTLPDDGSWVPFMVAGEFGTPSANDKDAIIEVHQDNTMGAELGTKALMVRIRKNANTLTAGERDRLLFAWRGFRNKIGVNNYLLIAELHRLASTAGDEAHRQPAFLTWHRVLLLLVERELQQIDPSVALHYWNWDAAAPNFFIENFIGEEGSGSFIAEPVFSVSNPLNGWDTELPFNDGELRRNTEDHSRDPAGAMKPLDHPVDPSLIDSADYGPRTSTSSFSSDVERRSHDIAHGWPCAAGHLTNPNRSAGDPLFFFLHSQIDREWAYWQETHDRFGVVSGGTLSFPEPAHYDNNGNWDSPGNIGSWQKGSFLEDGIWPWDGTTGGTPFSAEWRPENQATAPGTNVPVSMPLIPSSGFPASPQANLWPETEIVPLNRHMIDYLGKFRPQDGLGFSYDDVPY